METKSGLSTLDCAFNVASDPALWSVAVSIIRSELEVGDADTERLPLNSQEWHEIVDGGWDFTVWCFWLYIIILLHVLESDRELPAGLNDWINNMMA